MEKKDDKRSRSSPQAAGRHWSAAKAGKKQGSKNCGASSASFEDISALVRLEADLSARERLLQTIINTEPE
jgi:hypothetical protein